ITSSKAEGDIHLLGADFWRVLLRQYPFNTSVMAVRREAARAMRFDTDLVCWEDWDFVVRTADNYRVAYCRRPMILYRKRIGSITTTPDPRKFLSRARMFRKWRGLFRDLDEETTRDLRLWENDALITASYEFRSQSRRLALEWAWQALIQRPRWKGIRALAGALIR
ncbi:hypothetical protein HQ520_06005, partial [bacterium]|nr:hypothetical protein [bacterium]